MDQASEEIVETWLNLKGYFTMRNITLKGDKEIGFLAISLNEAPLGKRCRVEVQASPYSRVILAFFTLC